LVHLQQSVDDVEVEDEVLEQDEVVEEVIDLVAQVEHELFDSEMIDELHELMTNHVEDDEVLEQLAQQEVVVIEEMEETV
jgi:Fic family protein